MVENFATTYAVVFFVTVIALAICELLPRLNGQTVHVARRWPTNIGLFALNLAVLWICVPISAVDAANHAGSRALSAVLADTVAGIALGVFALDLWKYLEHRLMHRFSFLWRFHLVHHSDVKVDFTTTERHHPIEAAISTAVLYVLIYMIAIPPLAVVIFVLSGTVITLFSHANLCLPNRIDRLLRWLVVTPSVHVIHHSARREETDSNYGVILTVWDRLLGTYREPRRVVEVPIPMGLEIFRAPIDARLDRVLWQPIGYRARDRGPKPVAAPVKGINPPDAAWVYALMGIGLALVILVGVLYSTAIELVSTWSASATYGYAWLVVPALGYLLWQHRARFSHCRPTWSIVGIAATVACGVVWLGFDLANIGVGRQFAFVAAVPCIVLSAVGFRIFARLAQFLSLLILLVPSGDFLLAPLKALTVAIAVAAAALARIPYSVDGQMIFVGANRYVVVDDCAGLPYVLTSLFLGLTFGLLVYRSAWKVGLFGLFGIVCGIFANGVRVVSIVMLDWIQGTRLELSSHVFFQWVAFAVAVGVMVAVLMRVASEPQEAADQLPMGQDAGAGRRSLMAALGATLLAIAVPQIALAQIECRDRQAVAGEAGAGDLLPDHFAGWSRRGAPTNWSPAPRTPMPYALARYERGDRAIEVFVAAAERPRQKVTGYAIDLVGSGSWLEGKRRRLSNCSTPSCREVHVIELDRQLSDDVRHVYYVYTVGERIVGSALELQLQRAWNGLMGAPHRAKIIALATDGKAELCAAEVAEALDALAPDKVRD